ncbi:mycofactocin system GMC family oxidoreductase MftG [Arthrobacter sp. zg-Y238]|uniref:mycofactocin dehydrogenase MftG n=1 Tax=Arthrobacter sp. zg-Y238 TaxID=2964614 RepID=UPI002102A690|nr:mycofactocin system GMC family oxidoreductase MftG [Arthrobacter sp. zg-Y238]MCQ1953550.1 mycofactocin system GMC family oxidoreductase MftG [Arthrobacter sp. zg-Y238]
MPEHYDVIVVGGGGSGAPLAARVAEDPDRRVALIEAGPAPEDRAGYPSELLDAGTVQGAMPGHPNNWSFLGELTPGRPYSIARGRILGGSTALNGGYFVRAPKEDFDQWARVGGPAWSFAEATRLYSALEADQDFGAVPGHGSAGPVPVQRPPQSHSITRAFHQAARELGFPEEPDKNADGEPGVGPVPMNVAGGLRCNTALTYLVSRGVPANLTILGQTRVRRVLFEGARAVGVEVQSEGKVSVIRGNEIVLCAGAIQSAHLLLLSGIGPAAALRAQGIPVTADRPGVGAGFTDHPEVAVRWNPRRGVVDTTVPRIMESSLNFNAGGQQASGAGDLEILPMLKPMSYLLSAGTSRVGRAGHREDLEFLVALQEEHARGRLTILSANPDVQPRLEYNYLAVESDRQRMRYAVRTAVALLSTRAFRPLVARITEPLPAALAHDHLLDEWMESNLGTALHMSGTARMGPRHDPDSVVDSFGRVHGIHGLRVADTSILPTAPRRGPAATAVLIGELVAGHLRTGASGRPDRAPGQPTTR